MKKKFIFLRYKPAKAFSLVEMLMALLVASLLLAALAPVMTRRMADHELKVLSEAANYDKDSIVTIFTDSTEQQEFNIPQDVNRITLTVIGGGGSGGNALYGNKTFTSNDTFTVPDGVTKLRVFMIGGGGGGASGGGSGTAYGNITGSSGQQEYAGNTTANTGVKTWTIPSSAKGNVPAIDEKCKISGVDKWTLVSDNTKTVKSNGTVVTVKACGGGGGGGGGGNSTGTSGGGSGGFINNKEVGIPSSVSSVSITIGGGGGRGSTDDSLPASTGGMASNGAGWGGGAGGSESLNGCSSAYYAKGVFPGGNGGCLVSNCTTSYGSPYLYNTTNASGTSVGNATNTTCCNFGCAGGGYGTLEGGGGGGGAATGAGGGGGGGATFFGRYAYSTTDDKDFFLVAAGGGGGSGGAAGGGGGGSGGGIGGLSTDKTSGGDAGRGGAGGNNGSPASAGTGGAGGISPIGNANYCAGGKGGNTLTLGANGKNGYMLISWAPKINALKCDYSITSNGGGGGAAGQITIGEINVTPGETLTFEIGNGGAKQTTIASNGNNGNATHIKRGSSSIISANGGYGGEFSSSETTKSQGGLARNPNILNNWTGIDYQKNIADAAGNDGYLSNDTLNQGFGGKGGSSQNIKGEILNGGDGGNSIKNGNAPLSTSYGAGGGGGAGGLSKDDEYGTGAAGASGYIYIEWGGSNGGGGTMGEIVQKTLTNFEPDDRKMIINIGKGGESSINGGKGGDTNVSVKSGGKNVVITARGGIKGENGYTDKGSHGLETKYPDNYSDIYKEFITENMSIISGQNGNDNYGGTGGYMNCLYKSKDEEGNIQCAQTIQSNDGLSITAGPIRPGCGGTSITAPLYNSICIPYSTNASSEGGNGTFGAGGGGGAVLNNTQGKGGKGGDGFVILEYKSVL